MSGPEVALTTQTVEMETPPHLKPSQLRGQIRSIPFRVSVTVPLQCWKVQDLTQLHVGMLVSTGISAAEDVPVYVGGALLGYAELDNLDRQMAVRITRLS